VESITASKIIAIYYLDSILDAGAFLSIVAVIDRIVLMSSKVI